MLFDLQPRLQLDTGHGLCVAVGFSEGAAAAQGQDAGRQGFLQWKWLKGSVSPKANFGTPLTTTAYQLCVYDQTAGVPNGVLRANIPAGGLCGTKPCWKENSKGFKYKNKLGTPEGVTQILLKEGIVSGKSKILVKGKGVNIDMPTMPLDQDPAVKVQLVNSIGQCWEANYGTPAIKNQAGPPGFFKDKAD